MPESPRVFISYSHQNSEYENKILDFSNKLRAEGIDANVDLYEESPAEGWPRWMENQIQEATYVLVFCCKSYYNKFHSPNEGKGVTWEASIVYQNLYDAKCQNTKFIPVVFSEDEVQYILTPIKSFTYYNLSNSGEYDKLYWRLCGVQKNVKPPLGKMRALPEKERKTMFFSSPIDIELWNRAGWNGVLYLFQAGYKPVLGLMYKDYTAATMIFRDWKKLSLEGTCDSIMSLCFVVPPFPSDCWVYSDPYRNMGKGYFVHIGVNVDHAIARASAAGIHLSELYLTSISRYQWMDENKGSGNRDYFTKCVCGGSGYLLMPIGIRDKSKPIAEDNLIIDFDYGIEMKTAQFKKGTELTGEDLCQAVLNKPE